MKKVIYAIAIIAISGVAVSCNDSKTENTNPKSDTTTAKQHLTEREKKIKFNTQIDCGLKISCTDAYKRIYNDKFIPDSIKLAYSSAIGFKKELFTGWLNGIATEGETLKIEFGVYTKKFAEDIKQIQSNDADSLSDYVMHHLGRLTVFAVTYDSKAPKTPISCYNLGSVEP